MKPLAKAQAATPSADGGAGAAKRKRLSREERKRDFIHKAAELFAAEGFGGGTRELARQLGVTQPLLYRYFPSKDDLIEAVYRSVFLDRWDPQWDALIGDRALPLRQRLEAFYRCYTDAIFSPEWLRIYLFAGLKGLDLNRRYIEIVEARVLKRIIEEYRHEAGLPARPKPSAAEMELAWVLQGGIFYYGVRKHIYALPVMENKERAIGNALDLFLEGMASLFPAPAAQSAGAGTFR